MTAFEEAARLHGDGQLRQAAELYDQVLAADPRHVGAAFRLGSILLEVERTGDAAVLLRHAAALSPESPAIHLSLGEARRRLGKLREAGESFLTAMALDPHFVAPVFRLGLLLRQLGELEAAIACLEYAATGNLTAPELTTELDAARRARAAAGGRALPASTFAPAARDLALAAFLHLASGERARGKSERALELCSRALRQQPSHPAVLLCLGEALEELGGFDAALEHFRIASASAPLDAELAARIAGALEGGTLRQRVRELFAGARGLEIGGPSELCREALPIYPAARSIDGVNFHTETLWQGSIAEGGSYEYADGKRGRQFVCEASQLRAFADGGYDFVLASHCLEHCANPIATLLEWKRVVRAGGYVVLVLPDKRTTFDHRRPTTHFEHLLDDYQTGVGETDLTHLEEVLQLHDLTLDPPAGDAAQFRERSLRNFENRCLHHHVFDFDLLDVLLRHVGLEPMLHTIMHAVHQVVIGSKR